MFTLLSTQYRRQYGQWDLLIEYIFDSPLFWLLLTIIIILILTKKTRKEFHSHWNTLLDGFSYSSKDFYYELKKELQKTKIAGIDTTNVQLKEGGLISPRRIYLRINWKNYRYDVCAAPFGNGFFISWWLLNKTLIIEYLLSRFPLGQWLVKKMFPVTYYKIDTASMFMTYCQQAVLTVIERITDGSGTRALTEDEKKPILNDKNIFKR